MWINELCRCAAVPLCRWKSGVGWADRDNRTVHELPVLERGNRQSVASTQRIRFLDALNDFFELERNRRSVKSQVIALFGCDLLPAWRRTSGREECVWLQG